MKKLGVIIGRFQTVILTDGHRDFIQTVYNKSDELLIILGSSRARFTKKNPLDYETRKLHLQQTVWGERDTTHYANAIDYKSDHVWSQEIDKHIENTVQTIGGDVEVTMYGSRDSFIPHYFGKFKTEQLKFSEEQEAINATEQRILAGQNPLKSSDFRAGIIYATQNMFPKVHPTVDIAIFNEDYNQVLLGRKHAETLFRFIGGFTDPTDKSYEMAAKRETSEEAGSIEIDGLEYVTSTLVNDWRYPTDDERIMTILFAAKYIFGHCKAGDDIGEIKWVSLADLKQEDLVTEHGKLLQTLKEYMQVKHPVA